MDSKKICSGDCTGCAACKSICNYNAITMMVNEYGFPRPVIHQDKCVDCGLCRQICPSNKVKSTIPQKVYGIQSTNLQVLKDSTSGGAFFMMAREILNRGGVVYGCVWNSKYEAVIQKAETEEEIYLMHGSKYVWSNASASYKEILSFLKTGRYVMFTGLPCQAAALKNFLRKDYPNLVIVDFLCGGSPSPVAFKKYISSISGRLPGKELDFKFRNKDKGKTEVNITYQTRRGQIHQNYVENGFYYAFSSKVRMTWQESCYQCKYKRKERVSDLTIGDYWGCEKYHNEFDCDAGVSLLMVNSEKGRVFFEDIKEYFVVAETTLEKLAAKNSLVLVDGEEIKSIPAERKQFFEEMNRNGWRAAEKKYLWNKQRVKLLILTKFPHFAKLYEKIRYNSNKEGKIHG